AIGKQADLRELDAAAGLERTVHRIGILRFDADDFDVGLAPLHVRRNAGNQATTADRHEDRVGRRARLTQNFHRDRALPGNDVGIVVWMHKGVTAPACKLECMRTSLVVGIAVQHNVRAARGDRRDLDLRRGDWHDDGCRAFQALRGKRDALRMIAGRGRDHATPQRGTRQLRHFVVRAAQLEGEHRLRVLALEQQYVVQPRRQVWRALKRSFDRDVINAARLKDTFEVISRHDAGQERAVQGPKRSRIGRSRQRMPVYRARQTDYDCGMTQDDLKQAAARAAITHVPVDSVVGVGTGSTTNYFIDELAKIKGRINGAVASSEATAQRLKKAGIKVLDLNSVDELPVYVDGTDEVTRHLHMIKGGGGALTREKIVAAVARKFICIADESK